MRHLMFFIFVVLSNDTLLSQQPRTSPKVRFETVEEFVSDQETVRQEKQKFYEASDPHRRYTLGRHQSLWSNNIKLSLPFQHPDSQTNREGVVDNFTIDAFGMSTAEYIHERYPKLATDLMKKISREIVGKSITFDELYDLILKLKREVEEVWAHARDKEYDSVILRASLENYLSSMRNKRECWLLVEVFHARRNSHDLFISDFMDKLLRVKNKIPSHIIEPMNVQVWPYSHPFVIESRFLEKKRKPPQRDRDNPQVTVHDDLLSIAEREVGFGFTVIDETDRRFHQIEGCSWPDKDSARALRALSEANDLLTKRVPDGSYLSFEELHLRLGSVAEVLRRKYPEYKLIFTIKDTKINEAVYSAIFMDIE